MEVKLEKVYPLSAPADVAWRFLQDIRGVAECMPGAKITEQLDATHYKGQVNVKIGPASATFHGEITVKDVDASQRRLSLVAKGSDAKGSSAASMDLAAQIRTVDSNRSELAGNSRVTVSGKMAAFGGRMMTQVSDQILQQFAANLANRVAALAPAGGTPSAHAAHAAAPSHELNALALMWRVFVSFFRGLFTKKA